MTISQQVPYAIVDQCPQPTFEAALLGVVLKALDVLADRGHAMLDHVLCLTVVETAHQGESVEHRPIDVVELLPGRLVAAIADSNEQTGTCCVHDGPMPDSHSIAQGYSYHGLNKSRVMSKRKN